MPVQKDDIEKIVPEVDFLEERFEFISSKVLRTNLAISFQYIIFLITLQEEIELQGPISYSINKNIVLHTASIIEGSLHHLLDTLFKRKVLDVTKVMGSEEVYSNKKILYTAEDSTQICGITIMKKPLKLKPNTNFIDINRACKRAKILDQELFEKVEDLRDKRNKIHLAGLSQVDDFYDKQDIQNAFDVANEVLRLVEEKIKALPDS